MGVRVAHAAKSAERIVHWLLERPEVETVRWPALESDPSHAIWKRDYTGATSLFAVVFRPEYDGRLLRRCAEALWARILMGRIRVAPHPVLRNKVCTQEYFFKNGAHCGGSGITRRLDCRP